VTVGEKYRSLAVAVRADCFGGLEALGSQPRVSANATGMGAAAGNGTVGSLENGRQS